MMLLPWFAASRLAAKATYNRRDRAATDTGIVAPDGTGRP
jgi:hypothetical protein